MFGRHRRIGADLAKSDIGVVIGSQSSLVVCWSHIENFDERILYLSRYFLLLDICNSNILNCS